MKDVLSHSNTPFALVDSRECITGRHLLERTLAAAVDAIDGLAEQGEPWRNIRCESISTLNVHLQRLLGGCDRFVMVFDGIDKQREVPPTLLSALARFHETVCQAIQTIEQI